MDILLVDDDVVDRAHVVRTLRKSNLSVNVTEAITVDEGLQLYSQCDFDLVLLDYRMPQRDGIEMLVEIRNERKNSSTAIVMMSTSKDEQLAIECIKKGAQDFLMKSEISVDRLKRAILHAATRHDLEIQLFETYQKVKHLAETDSLTGLPNRYFFDESLKLAITNNRRSDHSLALLLIDLDNFKLINDNFGHDMGDLFLKKMVARIKGCLRDNELFARLGGDEFGITLSNLENNEHASVVAQRIINIMEQPLELASTAIHSTVSIGIALHPANGTTSEELFKHADIAMYRAKKQGKNQACFFEEEMQQKFYQRLQIELELRDAIQKNQLILHYQPVVDPIDNNLIGFEALIRWQLGDNVRFPAEFIEIAEETGQIIEIGAWVMEEAISTLARWNKGREVPLHMAINFSAIQLGDLGVVQHLKTCLSRYSVPAELIDVELTETALFKDTCTSNDVITQLVECGCELSLDDFGTGYSSISHLRNFPIATVKIDKSLMPEHANDTKRIILFRSVVGMASMLGLSVIAEGVETEEQLELCITHNVRRIQGFYFDKALSVDDVQKKYLLHMLDDKPSYLANTLSQ